MAKMIRYDYRKQMEIAKNEPCNDPIVEANVYQLRSRSRVGVAKYSVTLAENPAEVWERLEHLKQELMDGINYITWVQSGIRPDA